MATSSNGSDRDTAAVYAGFRLVWIINGWQFYPVSTEEAVMKWVGVACVAAAVTLGSAMAAAATKGAPQAKSQTASDATDLSARRVYRRYPAYPSYARYPVYPVYPTYYARPTYYRPYPYGVPVPFFLGFGYLPYY